MKGNINNQSRADLFAHQSLGTETAKIKSALRNRTIVIGIPWDVATTRQGQIGLATVVNILTRLGSLAPNIYLDVPDYIKALPRIPLLLEGQSVSCQMLNFMKAIANLQKENIVRDFSEKQTIYDLGLFIGHQTSKAKQSITIGSNNWLAFINPTGKQEKIIPSKNPLGTILSAALGATEIVKHLWLPVKDSDIEINPLRKRTVVSSYDFSINKLKANNPAIPPNYRLGHACIFGLGAIGSACNYILGSFDNPELSLDFVDPDKIELSNEERLFTSSQPAKDINKLKVIHAQLFMKMMNKKAHTFPYGMPLERFVEMSRDRLGYVFCCLDSGNIRRKLQKELASVVINGGTDLSRYMVSVHEFDRPENACLLDLYKEETVDHPDILQQLAHLLKINVNEIIRLQQIGNRRIDGKLVLKAIQQEPDPIKKKLISRYAGLTLDQALAHVCTQGSPNKALPAATISFVSLLPSVLMVADFVKRRVYGWNLPKGSPNVVQIDSFRQVNKMTAINILASDKCFCQSEKYVQAFTKRQKIRTPHLNKIFLKSAGQINIPRRPPVRPRPYTRPKPVHNRPQVRKPPQSPKTPVQPVAPRQLIEVPAFPTPQTCCFAFFLYLTGMFCSLFLISLFLKYEIQADNLPGPWKIITHSWEADITIIGWLKYSAISIIPVITYYLFMKLATYIMKGRKDNVTIPDETQKTYEIGTKWASKFLATLFQITGLPFLYFAVLSFGAINIRALIKSCTFFSDMTCCAVAPFVLFFFSFIILIVSIMGLFQTGEPTQERCNWIFNLPTNKKKKE